MSTDIPGHVYLCQVSETISCGACCGLYNIPELSYTRLQSILEGRTERLRSVKRTEDDLDDFALQELHRLGDRRPYPNFHHCPFLGLIGPKQSRVGCLLHPLVPENKGVDLRGLSYYGAAACRLYFCPSYYHAPARFKRIIKSTAPNWYLYGLFITEHKLISALFANLENRIGREISETDFVDNHKAIQYIQPLFELKERWPYRSPNSPGPCHYVFEDGEYQRRGSQYLPEVQKVGPYTDILDELDSEFDSSQAVCQAEDELEKLLSSLTQALES